MSEITAYPFDIKFQRKILALMVREPHFLERFPGVIQPQFFQNEILQTLCRQIVRHRERYNETLSLPVYIEELDRLRSSGALAEELYQSLVEEGSYIFERVELADPVTVRDHAVDFARDEAMRLALIRVVEEFKKDSRERVPLDEQIDWLVSAGRTGQDVRDMGMSFSREGAELPMRLRSSAYGEDQRIKTAFPRLNTITYGGLGRGELVVVLGLSGAGKTMCCINLAAYHLQYGRGKVLHYAIGDLHTEDVALRYAARLTGCRMYDVVRNEEMFLRRYKEERLDELGLWIKTFTPGTTTIGMIRNHLSALVAAEGFAPDIMILDYPDQLRGATGENMYEAMGSIYDEVLNIAYEYDLVAIVPSQISRTSRFATRAFKGEVLTQDHVANSSQKTSKADLVMSVNQSPQERANNEARIFVDKNRRGKSNVEFKVGFQFEHAFMCELDDDSEDGEGS